METISRIFSSFLDLAERGIAKVEPIDEYNNDDPYFDAYYNDDNDNIYDEPVKEESDKQFDLEQIKNEPSESHDIIEGLELNDDNFEEILKSEQKEKR